LFKRYPRRILRKDFSKIISKGIKRKCKNSYASGISKGQALRVCYKKIFLFRYAAKSIFSCKTLTNALRFAFRKAFLFISLFLFFSFGEKILLFLVCSKAYFYVSKRQNNAKQSTRNQI